MLLLPVLMISAACASTSSGAESSDLSLELRPADTEWDAEAQDEFRVGDQVILRVLLPPAEIGGEPVTVTHYRVRILGPLRTDQTRATPTNQIVRLDPPAAFRANDLPLLRWSFTVSDHMAAEKGRFTVQVTIPELDLRGSTRLQITRR